MNRKFLGKRETFIWKVQIILFVVSLVLELYGIYVFSESAAKLGHTVNLWFRCVILPVTINLFLITLEYLVALNFPKNRSFVRMYMLITLTGMCTVLSAFHYDFLNITMCLLIPILAAVLFISKAYLFGSFISSYVGLTIAIVPRFFDPIYEDRVVIESLITYVFIFIFFLFARMIVYLIGEKEREINNQKEIAMRANMTKTEFLSNISHEIRTPINSIIGMNEMILKECKDEKILEYAGNVHTSSNLLLSLINDILDITKMEAGKIKIIEDDYNLAQLLHTCCDMVADRIRKKNLNLMVECDPHLPSCLYGDEARVRQIIINFLSNAAKYTQKGDIRLSVNGVNEGGIIKLIVSVKDTGIGIRKEDLKNLFGRFERFDLKKNRNIEGTGLGLRISKELAELMGGQIEVSSEYGKGSEFIFLVSQRIRDERPIGEFHLEKNINNKVKVFHHSFEAPFASILAVDDVDMNLIVFENLLKETKIKVDLAESGDVAIEMASKKKYDIIFMDHMMPGMDGIETYRKLQNMETSNIDTPVIMLTANALSDVREEYMNAGFADYISKPINVQELSTLILKYLSKSKIIPLER